jgi:hypothetical protein
MQKDTLFLVEQGEKTIVKTSLKDAVLYGEKKFKDNYTITKVQGVINQGNKSN